MVLLNDLLDFSKLEAGKMVYEMDITNLIPVTKEIVADYRTMLEQKQIAVHIKDPEFLPVAKCDRFKVGQVIRNLISNAIKYSPEKSAIYVQFKQRTLDKTETKTSGLETIIMDNGIGIPEHELKMIFDKFSRGSLTKTESGGTGLGLAICRQIIRDHKGEIWAESTLGKGTTIHFTLPIAKHSGILLPTRNQKT
jgi:signal transduction histidine kinase